MNRWWERLPDRYRFELDALTEAGFTYEVDESAKNGGRVVLRVQYVDGNASIDLLVHFPDLYPYFPFGVVAPDLSLPHHQDPLTNTLCLLGSDTSRWSPKLTVAQLLKEQIPQLLAVAAPGHTPGDVNELLDGEPVTAYMRTPLSFSHVGFGDWSLPPEARRGDFLVGVDVRWPLHGTVLQVRDHGGTVIARADASITELYGKNSAQLRGRWARLETRPTTDDSDELFGALVEMDPALATGDWQPSHKYTTIDLVAGVFADELAFQAWADNWVFIARTREDLRGAPRGRGAPRKRVPRATSYVLRGGRDSRADFIARIPELKPVQQKKVALFGLGSLGSVSAIEFARSGVGELRLVDRDLVEVGNTVRWAIGRTAAGMPKTHALQMFIKTQYPHTAVTPHHFNLGDPLIDLPSEADIAQHLDGERIEKVLDGVDLVFDATAQLSVSNFLSTECWRRQIPYVWVTTTPGAWGGIVGRAARGLTQGCWFCFKCLQNDGAIASPLFSGSPNVQPVGCVHSTFTGAAVDINPIALNAVRLAMSTLCHGSEGAYPRATWDVAVINQREENGGLAPGNWVTYSLTRHAQCDHN